MRTDEGTSIALPASCLHADTNVHAYAATIHKAQCTTVDRAFIEAADRRSREPAYTASQAARRRTASTSHTPSPKRPTTATTNRRRSPRTRPRPPTSQVERIAVDTTTASRSTDRAT
jgi:hypothetical protein